MLPGERDFVKLGLYYLLLGEDHVGFQTNQSTSQSFGVLSLTSTFPKSSLGGVCVPYPINPFPTLDGQASVAAILAFIVHAS